jgi:hypothetical protein
MVEYLGHVLGKEGVKPNPEKVKAVENYPVPKSVNEFGHFLGLASFYRRMIPRYADKAKPLTELTRIGEDLTWTPRRQQAFYELKKAPITAPVLAYPDFKLPFILTTDASSVTVAAVLSQVQNGI